VQLDLKYAKKLRFISGKVLKPIKMCGEWGSDEGWLRYLITAFTGMAESSFHMCSTKH
jgi:hypothetical protein